MNAEVKAGGPWRCFHCDDVFTDWGEARNHFGYTPEDGPPACKTTRGEDSELYHLKRRLELYQQEDTELHRALAAKEADTARAVREAEEKGYARGLEDAKRHPETLGLQLPPAMTPASIHAMCVYIRDKACSGCKGHIETPYGGGTPGCFAIARETIETALRVTKGGG